MRIFKFIFPIFIMFIFIFNNSCTQRYDYAYFMKLTCDDKVRYIQHYVDRQAQKSWYAEGKVSQDINNFPINLFNSNFKAYIKPDIVEITIIPGEVKALKAKIIDTKDKLKVCAYMLGFYKCSEFNGDKGLFTPIMDTDYWSYNTLTALFPFKMEDVEKYSCDRDKVVIKLKDIDFIYRFINLQTVKVSKDIQMNNMGFRYDYLLKYEYNRDKLKKAYIEVKTDSFGEKVKIEYSKFEELKEKSE